MRSLPAATIVALLTASSAWAGNSELSLAALVGLHSPLLSAPEKEQLEKYLDGDAKASLHMGKITVRAEAVTCRMSNVDVTHHDCEVDFGTTKASFEGRKAHELYATLIENGVPSDGAAGSIYEGIVKLHCVINPADVKEMAGGGASCSFKTTH
jgi:hypothetical protein